MTRLIDANALKEAIKGTEYFNEYAYGFICDIIDNAPTVVNEYTKGFSDGERSGRHFPLTDEEKAILVRQWRPQGEWIPTTSGGMCPFCGQVSPNGFTQCRYCGALMKGIPYEERPQGEWIPKHLWDNTHIWVCSKCGNQNTHGITVEKACWKCGADMRKGGAE